MHPTDGYMQMWAIAGFKLIKPLRSLSGLHTLIFAALPAITYTKCWR